MPIVRYFLLLFIFTGIVFTISWFISMSLPALERPGLIYFQFGFFTLLTGAIHLGIAKTTRERAIKFVNAYMAASTAKLLLSLSIILFIAVKQPVPPIPFIIHFGVLYLVYTSFEIAVILQVLRPGKKD